MNSVFEFKVTIKQFNAMTNQLCNGFFFFFRGGGVVGVLFCLTWSEQEISYSEKVGLEHSLFTIPFYNFAQSKYQHA